jgi:hypothetical protein
VIIDGKVFRSDRCAETTTSATGNMINTWYSGKHRAFGGNVEAVMRPDGFRISTSPVMAGHDHDITAARDTHVLGALYWAASRLGLPCLADSGYEGAGQGVHTPIKQPRRRSPDLQRAAPRQPRDRGTRLRTAEHPLARTAAGHRQPVENRAHRIRRPRTHPISNTDTVEITSIDARCADGRPASPK